MAKIKTKFMSRIISILLSWAILPNCALYVSTEAATINLASGKTVTAEGMISGTDYYDGNPPSNIVDGDLNSKWATIYQSSWPADGSHPIWVQVDFGVATSFNEIDINYGDTLGRDLINYSMQYSNDGINFTVIPETAIA